MKTRSEKMTLRTAALGFVALFAAGAAFGGILSSGGTASAAGGGPSSCPMSTFLE